MSAVRLVALMRAREASPVEVVEAHLRRIERVNPRLNAVVTPATDALERAREAERSLARGDELPLHGLPVTVKDTLDTANLRTTNGSPARADRVPESDAPSVARLRAAGAIVIGKTNTSEFALDYTAENPVFGRTLNPHDAARTSGGSSGGCAAAVASCLTPAGLGSDLAGSIRIPAHFCGVAGLRPTAGQIPGAGHAPPVSGLHSLGASLGPLARHVCDLRLLFNVLAGRRDVSAPSATPSQTEAARGLRGLRVAWYTHDGTVKVADEIAGAVESAAGALKSVGMDAVDEAPPGVENATDLWLSLFEYATQRFIRSAYSGREQDAGRAARVIMERADRWGAPPLEQLLGAWDGRDRARAALLAWMERTPLFVAPVGAVPAFGHEEYGRVGIRGVSVPTFRAMGYAHAANVFDLPAACVPAGRTRGGLPVGVQIVGRPHEESLVLAAAGVVEAALGGWQRPEALF
jgi:Asp-tRNA(Asn)/Glu-tRNA(Gln) amidotransferase A subunit family amidase